MPPREGAKECWNSRFNETSALSPSVLTPTNKCHPLTQRFPQRVSPTLHGPYPNHRRTPHECYPAPKMLTPLQQCTPPAKLFFVHLPFAKPNLLVCEIRLAKAPVLQPLSLRSREHNVCTRKPICSRNMTESEAADSSYRKFTNEFCNLALEN